MLYCDHNATTPPRDEVIERMIAVLRSGWGNASSSHRRGSRARCAVEEARAEVAALIGAQPSEIVFTSGGTESNNLAVLGIIADDAAEGSMVISTAIEHASIREPLTQMERAGWSVRDLPVDAEGRVAVAALQQSLGDRVRLVTVGWANNEIGTVQPIAELSAVCRSAGVVFHTDAVQAVGKVPVDVAGIDLLSLSAHKIGGPQGVGALYVRRGLQLAPLQHGGGQERGRRAGTENVAGIVGMGEACRLAAAEVAAFGEAGVAMRDALWEHLKASISDVRRNGPATGVALPNTLNVSFDGVRGEALVAALDLEGVAVSSGSACAAGGGEPSHVLMALGQSVDAARDGVRFSFGRTNRRDDVELIAAATVAAVTRVRTVQRRRAS